MRSSTEGRRPSIRSLNSPRPIRASFLSELPEFHHRSLGVLRRPLVAGCVTTARRTVVTRVPVFGRWINGELLRPGRSLNVAV